MSTETVTDPLDAVILDACRRYAARVGYEGATAENIAAMFAVSQAALLRDVAQAAIASVRAS